MKSAKDKVNEVLSNSQQPKLKLHRVVVPDQPEGGGQRYPKRISKEEKKKKEDGKLRETLALHDPNRGLKVTDYGAPKGRGIEVVESISKGNYPESSSIGFNDDLNCLQET